jgi:hypothetical protein
MVVKPFLCVVGSLWVIGVCWGELNEKHGGESVLSTISSANTSRFAIWLLQTSPLFNFSLHFFVNLGNRNPPNSSTLFPHYFFHAVHRSLRLLHHKNSRAAKKKIHRKTLLKNKEVKNQIKTWEILKFSLCIREFNKAWLNLDN